MAEKAWRIFKDKMKNKRQGVSRGKRTDNIDKSPEGDTITVQRLSASVTGTAQKYARIGAREFVPYGFDDFTLENIKSACTKHFGIDRSMYYCDVVAGEQGPSCHATKQIPDFKVIHVRFVERAVVDLDEGPEPGPEESQPEFPASKKRCLPESQLKRKSQPSTSAPSPCKSKFVARSLSVVDMLKLGKGIVKTTTSINIYPFGFDSMTWSRTPSNIEFTIDEEPFGVGGFRKAFKAKSLEKEFTSNTWVVKKYMAKAVEDITTTGQTVEQHTKKVVQMHYLARNMAARLEEELKKKDVIALFEPTMKYNRIFFGMIGDECVTVEEYIEGKFTKYLNNNGDIFGDEGDVYLEKAENLVHYSHRTSEKELMLLDIQGCGNILCDPEIASKRLYADQEMLFCTGNLTEIAITNFIQRHKCNLYCNLLDLPPLSS